jgi:hypothetical protein
MVVFQGYGQLKPDVADWTCGAYCVIPDTSMDSLQGNGVLRVGNFVKLTRPGMRFLEVILLESPMSFSPDETAQSNLAH